VAESVLRNTLSVRTRPEGGPVASQVRRDGSHQDLKAPRLVILVHGFNNSAAEASTSYGSMIDQLHRGLPAGGVTRLGPIWEFHWPGDQARRSLPLAMIKGYQNSLAEVETVGQLLADFLAGQPRRQRVYIVAHSMGCRITLEVLKRARDSGAFDAYRGARIRGAFLLAAAVPVGLCRSDDPPPAYSTALLGCAERILYSRSDWVLRFSFRAGQPLTPGERGPAVGLTGGPTLRWRSGVPTRLGHGDYWGSAQIATEITARLGIRATRTTAMEPLPEARLPKLWVDAKKLVGRGLPRRFL
jgi:pimeloyl-ACP methyl ester carboxylesterase